MASLATIVESSGWKKFMAKLYGWGASIVIIGALFKIQHWKGSGLFLTLGLCTEAIIFFFSAFEPLHEELDWTLVYPELAGMTEQDEMEEMKQISPGFETRQVQRIENLAGGSTVAGNLAGGVALPSVSLDEKAMKDLGEGLQKLNLAAVKIADLSAATVATKDFVNNIQNAASSIGSMNESYTVASQAIKDSASSLANAYMQSAETVRKSGSQVADSYQQIVESIKGEQSFIAQRGQIHEQHLESLNKNLSALNAVYELQIKEGSEHLKGAQQVYSGVGEMIQKLKDSIDETNRYKEEIVKLRDNLSSLNSIYGNMLSAMNMIVNK